MPIEIRELVVRARIDPGADSSPGQRGPGSGPAAERETEAELAGALVREALRAIADRQER